MHAEMRVALRVSRGATLAALLCSLVSVACALPHDRIEAGPPALTDVEADIKRALLEAIGIDAAAVRVRATPGTVTLDGFVASEAERRAVLDAAGTAAPERHVVDALTVRR